MTHPFRLAVEARDIGAMSDLLDPDVVFWSPVAFAPFRGRGVVSQVLEQVLQVFEDFRYVDELDGSSSSALVFSAVVAGKDVGGLDHLRLGPDGLITEFTVMVRPLSGLIALAQEMGPRVAGLVKG